MFRVETNRSGSTRDVFTWEDPRKDGYKGAVEDQVRLDHNENIYLHPAGADMPAPCLGRRRDNPKEYKVFRDRRELEAAGYDYVSSGTPPVFGSWQDYKRFLRSPKPEEMDEEDWFDLLDNIDDESRRLRDQSPWPEAPADSSRDSVAEWLARQHIITSPSIREVWYLPGGAPPHEIRFLEVSERSVGNLEKVEPLDFGVEELGKRFRLSVADLSGEQLEQVRLDPNLLPTGWTFDGGVVRRRRDP